MRPVPVPGPARFSCITPSAEDHANTSLARRPGSSRAAAALFLPSASPPLPPRRPGINRLPLPTE
eukprot:11840966-Heterocapsa_arctica.AAC.1